MKIRILLLMVLMMSVAAIGQQPKKETLEKQKKSITSKANELRQELRKTRREASVVVEDIKKTDALLEEAREKLSQTVKELEKARARQNELEKELKKAEEELQNKKTNAGERLRAIYMRGETRPLTLILASDSLGDLASRAYIVRKMAEKDTEVLELLNDARAEVEAKKNEADEIVERVNNLRRQQALHKQDLDRKMTQKRSFLNELKEAEKDIKDELDELEKESRKIEQQLRMYYASGGGSKVIWTGKWLQPVSGRISSGYGMRVHPISGRRKMHTGIDIAAPTGTPIKAAGSGVVIAASYMGGYGNTVIIDHGGGIATLYGHCSKLYVSAGQKVKQGDIIAAVGSTGYSTGPHLHWEVRKNGSPVNPSR